MIIPDKKKAVTVILSKLRPDGSETRQDVLPEDEMDENDSDLKAIAEDMLHAYESKSASDLVTALKAFISCMKDDDSEESEG